MRSERGFTLVELLVVVLIVSILAVIGLATFLNQRAKGQDAQAKQAAALVATTLLIHHQSESTFATADRNALIALEPAVAEARGLVIVGGADRFEIAVTLASGAEGGGPFRIEHDAGRTVRRCDGAGHGGCPQSGLW